MLFKQSSNNKMEEIRKYLPVSAATSFQNISPFIQAAETTYILPLLGQKLYNLISAFYNTTSPLPDGISSDNKAKYTTLLGYIQHALIHLTYWDSFDYMNVMMNDSGFHRQESETDKTLFKYQEESLKSGFKSKGFNGLDTMLAFIESDMVTFPLFAESPNYTERKSSLIPTAAIFSKIFNINNSRLMFLKLCPYISQAEDFDIQATLGAALYNRVKTEIAKDTPDAKILTLLPYIQKPLAHLSVARAGFHLGISITDKGLFFESQDSTQQNSQKITPLSDQQYFALAQTSKNVGESYTEILTGFLSANPTDYPEYKPVGGSPFIRDNTDKSTVWQ